MTMRWQGRIGGAALVGVLAMSEGHAIAQNGSQFRAWKPSALADGVHAKPRAACAALVALTGYEFSIIAATPVAASNDAPEYCRVSGQIQPEIRFEVSLPAVWNAM